MKTWQRFEIQCEILYYSIPFFSFKGLFSLLHRHSIIIIIRWVGCFLLFKIFMYTMVHHNCWIDTNKNLISNFLLRRKAVYLKRKKLSWYSCSGQRSSTLCFTSLILAKEKWDELLTHFLPPLWCKFSSCYFNRCNIWKSHHSLVFVWRIP